jgi:nitroimidazol reductase NimA-like FMN-containing flavoprotein (pyridoxamine 5'-phosphate oxidase superfamily)
MIRNLNKKECLQIIQNNYIGHLAYLSEKMPFVVPITYYFNKSDNNIICYSSQGRKIKAMRKNKYISLSVDEIVSVNQWRTVLIEGVFEELEGPDAKYYLHEFAKGVKKIMLEKEQKEAHFINEFSSKLESEGTPIVFKILIIEITGKQRISNAFGNQKALKSNLV